MTEQHGLVQKTEGGHRLSFQRPYATNPGDLWEAMTSPPRVKRWLADLTGDLRVGGRYRLDFGDGSDPDQVTEGTIEVCEPPMSLKVTWSFGTRATASSRSLSPPTARQRGCHSAIASRPTRPRAMGQAGTPTWTCWKRRPAAPKSPNGTGHSCVTSPTIRTWSQPPSSANLMLFQAPSHREFGARNSIRIRVGRA